MSFESELKEFIKDYEKLILLGVGNILKKDDGAGPYIISKLEEKENILLIDGQTMPENFTGLIRKANPSHLLIIDACLMNEEPGTIKLVNREDFVNIGISTHSMSLNYFVKYLERDLPVKVANIGIQPESMDFGEDLTLKVYNNCNEFIILMKETL